MKRGQAIPACLACISGSPSWRIASAPKSKERSSAVSMPGFQGLRSTSNAPCNARMSEAVEKFWAGLQSMSAEMATGQRGSRRWLLKRPLTRKLWRKTRRRKPPLQKVVSTGCRTAKMWQEDSASEKFRKGCHGCGLDSRRYPPRD